MATCGDGILDLGEECEAPFGGCCNESTCLIEVPKSSDSVSLSSRKDTRLMQRQQASNDGASGLIWLKRGGNSRGLVGFDLSCQESALENLECALLRAKIHAGIPIPDGTVFAAHKMHVPFLEGNHSFNPFSHNGFKLGPTTGSGQATTWGCQIDQVIGIDMTNDCGNSPAWKGGDDCNGSLSASVRRRRHGCRALRWGSRVPRYRRRAERLLARSVDDCGSLWRNCP